MPIIIMSNTSVVAGSDEYNHLKNAGVTTILRKYETSLPEIRECLTTHLVSKVREVSNHI
jgi:hypothetical protein